MSSLILCRAVLFLAQILLLVLHLMTACQASSWRDLQSRTETMSETGSLGVEVTLLKLCW